MVQHYVCCKNRSLLNKKGSLLHKSHTSVKSSVLTRLVLTQILTEVFVFFSNQTIFPVLKESV